MFQGFDIQVKSLFAILEVWGVAGSALIAIGSPPTPMLKRHLHCSHMGPPSPSVPIFVPRSKERRNYPISTNHLKKQEYVGISQV